MLIILVFLYYFLFCGFRAASGRFVSWCSTPPITPDFLRENVSFLCFLHQPMASPTAAARLCTASPPAALSLIPWLCSMHPRSLGSGLPCLLFSPLGFMTFFPCGVWASNYFMDFLFHYGFLAVLLFSSLI
jgi:hypothetical protein